jgi:dynein heavy chain, axonemal
MWDLVSLIDL